MTANTLHHALGTAMLAAIVVGSALAGNLARSAYFESMDGNGDGVISASEHATGAMAVFNSMDADQDGRVSAAEMDRQNAGGHVSKHAGKQVTDDDPGAAKADSGALSSTEKIAVLDQDGDGKLSQIEHATGANSMFAKADTNLDGNLSPSEMAAARTSMLKHD